MAENGELVAKALVGAWRSSPPPLNGTAGDLERIAPLLHRSGSGALGWWRARGSPLEASRAADGLLQAFRLQALQAAVHRRRIALAFRTLRAAGVEPILGKGWAAARLYPEEGLRPYSDIDLAVRPEEYPAASALLPALAREGSCVDLHRGFPELSDTPPEALHARSRLLPVDDVPVRVLGPEDHLRLLGLHMLRHGAWRPLWLCDLGAALESRPEELDWPWLLGRDPRRADWVVCALGLAHELLGACLDGAPDPVRERRLPAWLVPAVLRQWGRVGSQLPQGARTPMAFYLRRPRGVLRALQGRWPNPIEGTVGVRGPFNELPRWPFQIGACLWRTAGFVAAIPALLRERG